MKLKLKGRRFDSIEEIQTESTENFAKWLSCGIQISGTFGLHHVLTA
jgi:hypothetical protein